MSSSFGEACDDFLDELLDSKHRMYPLDLVGNQLDLLPGKNAGDAWPAGSTPTTRTDARPARPRARRRPGAGPDGQRPEITATALRDWCRFSGAERNFIEPGSRWQDSFGSRVRDEVLSVEAFDSVSRRKRS